MELAKLNYCVKEQNIEKHIYKRYFMSFFLFFLSHCCALVGKKYLFLLLPFSPFSTIVHFPIGFIFCPFLYWFSIGPGVTLVKCTAKFSTKEAMCCTYIKYLICFSSYNNIIGSEVTSVALIRPMYSKKWAGHICSTSINNFWKQKPTSAKTKVSLLLLMASLWSYFAKMALLVH